MNRLLFAPLFLALATPSLASAGPRVLAGGGSEGDVGDTRSWSYRAYGALVDVGDVNADGEVTVAILSSSVETDWLPGYFEWLGADRAFNVWVPSRSVADDAGQVDSVRGADIVFIKGGDQGVYYDAWNDTRLEENIRLVVQTRGGAIGGTSAGAMSQSAYCFAGGQDLISLDVLEDGTTPYLDDTDGGSGIHDDFLGFVGGVVVDTHYTSRGRLARMMGIQAKAMDDYRVDILAVGLEERTAIVVNGDLAEIVGDGSVDFIQPTNASIIRRERRKPLIYTDARLDRLTEGWVYDLASRQVHSAPRDAQAVSWSGHPGSNSGNLTLYGDDPAEVRDFARTVTVAPLPYGVVQSGASPYILQSVGLVDAQDSDRRGTNQESIFRALYDNPGDLGLLITDSARVNRTSSEPDLLGFRWNAQTTYRRAASIVIDGKGMTQKGLSANVAPVDSGSGSLRSAALVGLKVHILADTGKGEPWYDSRLRQVVED